MTSLPANLIEMKIAALLPLSVRAKLPAWRATANQVDPIASVKLFLPGSRWTWYIVEFNPEDNTCFGLVAGFEVEAGYWSMEEIVEAVESRLCLPVERDLHFQPKRLSELRALHGARF